jgi:hypothetical protein
VKLIGKFFVKRSPKNVIDENFDVTSVFSVSISPPLLAPDQRFSRRAVTKSPLMEILSQSKSIYAVRLRTERR